MSHMWEHRKSWSPSYRLFKSLFRIRFWCNDFMHSMSQECRHKKRNWNRFRYLANKKVRRRCLYLRRWWTWMGWIYRLHFKRRWVLTLFLSALNSKTAKGKRGRIYFLVGNIHNTSNNEKRTGTWHSKAFSRGNAIRLVATFAGESRVVVSVRCPKMLNLWGE